MRAAALSVAILGLCFASVSAQEPVKSVGIAGARNTGVGLAASGDDVVLTWAAGKDGATNAYAAVSRDGGLSFAAPVRVNDVPGDARVSGEQAPRAVLGKDLAVVWLAGRGQDPQVRLARSTDGGRTFAPAGTAHAADLEGLRGWPSLASGTDGSLHAVWLDGRLASPRQDLFQATLSPDGRRTEVTIAQDVCFCCKTSVAAGPRGATYVAFRNIYPTNLRDIAVAASADGGRSFGAPVRVSQDGWQIDGCPDDGPSIAVDAAGVVHVAWPTVLASTSDKAIFYSYSTDGGRSFAPRMRVDDGPGSAHPQLALTPRGVAIVWEQAGPAAGVVVREIGSKAGAASWSPHLGPASALGGGLMASYPAIASTPRALVVAWSRSTETGSDIELRRLAR